MANSSPETVKVTSSPSASVAVTVPIAVWFSAALKVASEVNSGAMSFTLVTVTVMSWVVSFTPSVAVTVAVYEDLVSKSGAVLKVKTPAEVMASSVPETVKVTSSSSASVAVTVPMVVWFSSALKEAGDVNTGK